MIQRSTSIFRHIKDDLPASLVVFLVALPLCLGIALASGAPLFAGVISGIIGGIVVSSISGSHLSISGPAAGLTIMVADAIRDLGSFSALGTAIILCGIFQICLGLLKAGMIGEFFPTSVIRGMLWAIGLVIVLKQIPHAIGRDNEPEGVFAFSSFIGQENTLSNIIHSLSNFSIPALMISFGGIFIIYLWKISKIVNKTLLKQIPSALLVVVLGVAVNEAVKIFFPEYSLLTEKGQLVALPVSKNISEFFNFFTIPSFSNITDPHVIRIGATLAIIASIETLLSVEAVDKIDPYHRISPTNRELVAQGVGNSISGFLGGLPLTAVIVRSSANVNAGAKSKLSGIVHGVLLLLSTMLIPVFLNKIPLACLSAILITVGYKLAHPAEFRIMYRRGWDQFIPFIVTIIAIIFTDLLIGVTLGIIVGLVFVIRANRSNAISYVVDGNDILIRFNKDMTFLHRGELKELLLKVPNGCNLIFDGTKAMYIDQDIRDLITDYQISAPLRGSNVQFRNLHSKALHKDDQTRVPLVRVENLNA